MSCLFDNFIDFIGKDDVHRNPRRRRRIRMGSNPTSDINKCMSYISGMIVKTGVACITEGKNKIRRIVK